MPLYLYQKHLVCQTSVWAGLLAALLFGVACRSDAGGDSRKPSPVNELTWSFSKSPMGPMEVVVTVPKPASAKNRMPVLFALHGQGESRKPPAKGARGWPDDYGMLRAFERLASPPLTRDDFGGMVRDKRLDKFNRSLKSRPYRGVIVVSPYLPDRFRKDRLHEDAAGYADFLVNTVLPRVRKETPAVGKAAATGIDGVSLGGRASVVVGLTNPNVFGAVGGIQAAFGKTQVESIASLLKQAREKNPDLRFRLLSSEKDRFRKVTRLLSEAFTENGETHQIDIVEGDHSYAFNRGPGVYEMLLYYDRILRGEDLW